jgi:hypothetical protein
MRTVDIPGGTATFREEGELRGRDSKLVKAAAIAAQSALEKLPDDAQPKPGETREQTAERLIGLMKNIKLDLTQEEAMRLMSMKEAIVIAYLASWTLDLPLPTLETIGDLPGPIYDALDEAVGGEYIKVKIGTDFSPSPDKDSPTGPSSDSASRLRGEAENQSTSRSPNGTDHSSTEDSSLQSTTTSSSTSP